MDLHIDIETILSQAPDARAEIERELRAGWTPIKAPGNYKDADKITAHIAEATAKREADLAVEVDTAWRKTSLDAARGQVLSIAWAVDDDNVVAGHSLIDYVCPPDGSIYTRVDECTLLKWFFSTVDQRCANRIPRVVAHHADFDIRFIWQRAVIIGVRPPLWWPVNTRPWDTERVFDTMVQWAGARDRISLDALCRALCVRGKDGVDGSMVWDLVAAGRIDEVLAYNRDDVERVRACAGKMLFMPAAPALAPDDAAYDEPELTGDRTVQALLEIEWETRRQEASA